MPRMAGTKRRGASNVTIAQRPLATSQGTASRAAALASGNTPDTAPIAATASPQEASARYSQTARSRPKRTTRLRLPTSRS
jgi:hypothetical protein